MINWFNKKKEVDHGLFEHKADQDFAEIVTVYKKSQIKLSLLSSLVSFIFATHFPRDLIETVIVDWADSMTKDFNKADQTLIKREAAEFYSIVCDQINTKDENSILKNIKPIGEC